MDIGVISVRYARALLKASAQAAIEDTVYRDMLALTQSFAQVPEIKAAVGNPMLAKDSKKQLLTAAMGEPTELTRRFVQLVLDQDREPMVLFIAHSFVSLYRKQKNIIRGRLITATPPSEELQKKMEQMVASRSEGANVEFVTETDLDIIGGFILEYDTYRMDSSVKTRLHTILSRMQGGSI